MWTENSSYQNSINQSTSETGNDNHQCRLNSLEEKQSDDTNAVEMTVVQQPGNTSSDGTIDLAADDNGSHHVVSATTTIMDAPPPEAVPARYTMVAVVIAMLLTKSELRQRLGRN